MRKRETPERLKCRRWSSSAMRWRRTSTIYATPQASSGCSACRLSCSRRAHDPIAEQAFREIARLTHGAYCRFDPGAAHQLAELLRAVAAYAAGGVTGARRSLGASPGRRHQAPAAIKIAMPRSSSASSFCVLLWGLHAFTKADPQMAGGGDADRRRHRGVAGAGASCCARPLDFAIPLGLTGLGCWAGALEHSRALAHAPQKSAGQVSRVRSPFVEMELDHDSGAMRGTGPRRAACRRVLDALDLATLAGLWARSTRKPRATDGLS